MPVVTEVCKQWPLKLVTLYETDDISDIWEQQSVNIVTKSDRGEHLQFLWCFTWRRHCKARVISWTSSAWSCNSSSWRSASSLTISLAKEPGAKSWRRRKANAMSKYWLLIVMSSLSGYHIYFEPGVRGKRQAVWAGGGTERLCCIWQITASYCRDHHWQVIQHFAWFARFHPFCWTACLGFGNSLLGVS